MTTQERRLSSLEAQTGGNGPYSQNEDDWMSSPPVLGAIFDTARVKAERRWLFAHGHPAFGTDPWGGIVLGREHGWLWRTDEETRDVLILAEVEALDRLVPTMPFYDALREWCDDADRLVPYWQDVGYARFRDQLRRERASRAIHAEWQRRHPEWHPDFTEDEYDAWELGLLSNGALQ